MPPSAHAALVVSIIASALGALIMCLLVARYGLTPAAHETADSAARRLVVTRFGHAFAGVCFVATGILALVTIAVQARQAPPAPPPAVVVEPDRAAKAQVEALVAEVKAIATRLDQIMTRVATVDTTTKRLGDEVASVSLRARQMERAIAAPPRRVPERPAKDAADSAPPRETVRAPAPVPERPAPTPAPSSVAAPPVTAPSLPQTPAPPAAPRTSTPTPPMPAPPVALRPSPPMTRAPEPPAPTRMIPATPEPADTPRTFPAARAPEPTVDPRALPSAAPAPERAYVPRSLPSASRAPAPAAPSRTAPPSPQTTAQAPPRGAEGGAAAAKPDDLVDKLREDWKTIRKGLSTAGDDFKDAVQDLGRKLWR